MLNECEASHERSPDFPFVGFFGFRLRMTKGQDSFATLRMTNTATVILRYGAAIPWESFYPCFDSWDSFGRFAPSEWQEKPAPSEWR